MLYLNRKIGESIIIANEVEMVVKEIKGGMVKLGFKFPRNITVLRKEIYNKIKRENLNATQAFEESFLDKLILPKKVL
ncbi:MAG: hypothetical protein BGO27_04840 [Alphaproteobacteria bacterium 33-17]|nr:MAG: hypothetical protein BGO27_04840 [Alphaproteobacteria bacterium 33-17]